MTHQSHSTSTAHRALVWALTSLVCLPFIVTPGLPFPYVSGRAIVFRTTLAIAGMLAAWTGLYHLHNKPTPLRLVATLIVGWALLTSATSIHPIHSWMSTLERWDGTLTTVGVFALAFLATQALGPRDWVRVWLLTCGVSLLFACHLVGTQHGQLRPGGLLGSPTFAGGYLALHTVLWLALALRHRSTPWKSLACAAASVVLALAVWRTGTRGSVVALIAAAAVFAVSAQSPLSAALATRADKRPALLLRTELVVAAEAAGQSETLIGLWRQFAVQDRPNFRTKLRAFLAQLRRFE